MASQPAAERVTRTHLQRLQEIEQHIISAVEASAAAVEEMAKLGPLDKANLQQQCEQFLAKIQAAHVLVQEGAENPVPDREFKATVYQQMSRAHASHEKVQTVSLQLANMLKTLQQRQQQPQQRQLEAAAPTEQQPSAAGEAGGGMDIDGQGGDVWESI